MVQTRCSSLGIGSASLGKSPLDSAVRWRFPPFPGVGEKRVTGTGLIDPWLHGLPGRISSGLPQTLWQADPWRCVSNGAGSARDAAQDLQRPGPAAVLLRSGRCTRCGSPSLRASSDHRPRPSATPPLSRPPDRQQRPSVALQAIAGRPFRQPSGLVWHRQLRRLRIGWLRSPSPWPPHRCPGPGRYGTWNRCFRWPWSDP